VICLWNTLICVIELWSFDNFIVYLHRICKDCIQNTINTEPVYHQKLIQLLNEFCFSNKYVNFYFLPFFYSCVSNINTRKEKNTELFGILKGQLNYSCEHRWLLPFNSTKSNWSKFKFFNAVYKWTCMLWYDLLPDRECQLYLEIQT
jgi:hypothetical protein